MQDNQKYLLPVGFYDLLDAEALANQKTIDILLRKFSQSSYQLIKTPLVEFVESLKDNQKVAQHSFKIFDNFSGKDLVIRSDITTQIARLMATRFKNRTLPIRLCYVGDVLKVKSEDLYSDRQLTQAGIELIGVDDLQSNLEVVNIIADSLRELGLRNLIFDFCIPQFLETLLAELPLEKVEALEDLGIAIRQKNVSAIKTIAGAFADVLITLVMEINDLEVINRELKRLPIGKNILGQINNFEKVVKAFIQSHQDLSITVNIFGDTEFLYQEQIGFTVFAADFCYPIARGGRYKINQQIPATGSTVYINNLRKILVGNI